MATVRVKPAGGKWLVTKNGVTQSTHRKKKRALSSAKSVARSGDSLIIQRANGTIQNNRRVR